MQQASLKWNPAKLEPIAKWYPWFGMQPSCVPCPGLWSSAILTATRPFGPSSSRATEWFCAPTECKAWRNQGLADVPFQADVRRLQVFEKIPLGDTRTRRCHIVSLPLWNQGVFPLWFLTVWHVIKSSSPVKSCKCITWSPQDWEASIGDPTNPKISQFNSRTRGGSFSYVQLHGFVWEAGTNNPANLIMFPDSDLGIHGFMYLWWSLVNPITHIHIHIYIYTCTYTCVINVVCVCVRRCISAWL